MSDFRGGLASGDPLATGPDGRFKPLYRPIIALRFICSARDLLQDTRAEQSTSGATRKR